jgi:hypothetical protein
MESIDVMLEPLQALLRQLGAFLPRLALALVVVAIGWVLAKAVRFSVVKALRAFNFDVLAERAGVDAFLQQGGSRRDTCDLFGAISFWLVIFSALLIAFGGLGLAPVTDLLSKVLLFIPRLFVALLIAVLGSYLARFVGQSAAGHCRQAGIGDADLLGHAVQYLIMVFVLLLAVDQLDVGGGLIQQTFLILLGGVVLALALAFGIGGREHAAQLLERWFARNHEDPRR